MALPIKFTVALPGQESLAVALQRFQENLADFTPFWNLYFVPAWYALMARQYATQGAETGPAWDALTAAYAAWKEKHWPGQPIGVLTGATRAALTNPADPYAVLNVSKDEFAVGTDLPYPIFLQLGTRRMPARPPMRVTQEFMRQVGKLLQKFGHDAATGANLPLPLTGGER